MKIALLALFCLGSSAHAAPKNPDTLVYLTENSDPQTLDPAWWADLEDQLVIFNVYEPLVGLDGASLTKFTPLLSEKVPSIANGLISADGKTYRFPIRRGVKFHDGSPLTAEDARYSLMRFVLTDRSAGPSYALLQPLLGYSSTRDASGKIRPGVFADARRAIAVEGDELVLRLAAPYPPLLATLAVNSPIVSKKWAIASGDWDGREATWARFNDPPRQR